MRLSLRSLFTRRCLPLRAVRCRHRKFLDLFRSFSCRQARRRGSRGPVFSGTRVQAKHFGLQGFAMLEARAMLAADDIAVSLAGGRVVLLLDPLGAEISSLPTSYNAASRVLSIRAATAATPG